MILFSSPTGGGPGGPESAYIESAAEMARPIKIIAEQRPTQGTVPYKLNRSLIALDGGKLLLRLNQSISVELNSATWTGYVPGWNLTVPAGEIHDLPRLLARKFLTLFSKVDNGTLNADEKKDWIAILDQVDYRQFSIDRAPPRYLEGELLGRQPSFVRVRWHDDTIQTIKRPVAAALDLLTVGDTFSCYAKLGLNESVLSIERLAILTAA